MSFEIGGDTVALEFEEGTLLAGATVRCRLDLPFRKFLALQRAIVAGDLDPDEVEAAYTLFGNDCLSSWDITRDGKALPATAVGVMELPLQAARELLVTWLRLALDLPGNSNAASTNGEASQAAPVKMVRRSRNRRSS